MSTEGSATGQTPVGLIEIGGVVAGRYQIQRLLRHAPGKAVYLAHDKELGCQVVLDMFSNNAIMPSGLTVSAWETLVLGRLGANQRIADVLDHSEDPDGAFMVSRYLPGGSLKDLIAQRRESEEQLQAEKIVELSEQIAEGLAHIHACRILYRDLQPRNVLLDEWGDIHLVDFDTAVSSDDREMSDISHRSVLDYTAPEQLRGEPSDERGDLYSLGATMYEMCCGRPPQTGSSDQILDARASRPPPVVEREDLPYGLRRLVADLLAYDRQERPPNADEVLSRLRTIRAVRADLERFLTSNETTTLEFKASLRTPIDPPLPGQKITELKRGVERAVIKTIAGFLNSQGGTLLVGVKDDRSVIGIEVDYPDVSDPRDRWALALDNLISRDLGPEVLDCVTLDLEPWEGKTVAVVRCRKRNEPTWIKDDLFVRGAARTEMLSARHAVAYVREHWGS